jgi:hypothetical protein
MVTGSPGDQLLGRQHERNLIVDWSETCSM